MISTIEGPFEDELVTSLLARTFHGIIGPTRTQFAEYIFGSATVVPVDFTCQMDAIAEKIGRKVGLGVEDLIFNHTMYPLGAFLMTSAQAEAAKKAMRVGKGAARHLPKWHRERAEDGLRHLKFCHACRAGDFKRTGTTWWRRVHQVPGVVCCHRHRCSLEISQFVPGRTWKHDYPPAELAVSVRQDLEPDKIDLAYVKDVHWVLGTNHSKIDPHELHLLYHERLRKMGLLNGWQLRRREFLDRFHAQRPRKEWEKRHLAFDPQDNSAWPAAVVKTKPNHESFQMHFLVMRFLGIPINGLSRMLDGIQEKVPKPEMTDHAWCRSFLRKKWNNPRWTNKALLLHLKIGVGRMYSIAEKDGLSIPRLPDRKSSQAFIKRRFQMRALVALGPEKIDPLRWSRLLRWMPVQSMKYFCALQSLRKEKLQFLFLTGSQRCVWPTGYWSSKMVRCRKLVRTKSYWPGMAAIQSFLVYRLKGIVELHFTNWQTLFV